MVRSTFAMIMLWTITSIAHHDPITELPLGIYLGEGSYIRSDGEEGTYASHAKVSSYEVDLSLVRDGELFTYNLDFDFDANGFFEVHATEHAIDGQELTHQGYGYCASVQCHYTIPLTNRVIEETITFWEENIYKLGSMRYKDADGEDQIFAWEERLLRLGDNDDEYEDDKITPTTAQ